MLIAVFFFVLGLSSAALAKLDLEKELAGAALYVEDRQGHPVVTHNVEEPLVPASILKYATALAALRHLGPDYRFTTRFYLKPTGELVIKGFGDPVLTSQEIEKIAIELADLGLDEITGIVIDESAVTGMIMVPGTSEPPLKSYDAINAALLVNFNTLWVNISPRKEFSSGDPHTPLTPLALKLAKNLKGRQRINLANYPEESIQYVGEIFANFLEQMGIKVANSFSSGFAVARDRFILEHRSSKNLLAIVAYLMKTSNNFVANQILLATGAEVYGWPATLAQGVEVIERYLRDDLGMAGFTIVEGSGLSRDNRLSASQMMTLVELFEPYRELLQPRRGVTAKTGTMSGIRTIAGYFTGQSGKDYRFVYMRNGPGPERYGLVNKIRAEL